MGSTFQPPTWKVVADADRRGRPCRARSSRRYPGAASVAHPPAGASGAAPAGRLGDQRRQQRGRACLRRSASVRPTYAGLQHVRPAGAPREATQGLLSSPPRTRGRARGASAASTTRPTRRLSCPLRQVGVPNKLTPRAAVSTLNDPRGISPQKAAARVALKASAGAGGALAAEIVCGPQDVKPTDTDGLDIIRQAERHPSALRRQPADRCCRRPSPVTWSGASTSRRQGCAARRSSAWPRSSIVNRTRTASTPICLALEG